MANNRIAYGIAKQYGIDTTDMDPEQVWEAIDEKRQSSVEVRQNESYDKIMAIGKDSYSLPDETLPKSLSAKWANYDIAMPDGTVAHFVEGSKLHNIEVFAGKGTKKPIRDVERLVKTYGGKPEDWMKVKGIGTISHMGEGNKAEIHWYQANGVGKEELKFKRYV